VTTYDGPTLRAVRESMGVPLRRIARHAGMSHGHLSKVERGEYGRPVTPAIMAAYERVTGVRLADAVAAVAEQGEPPEQHRNSKGWRPGHLSEMRRRGFSAAIGALNAGGHLGEPLGRLLDSTGRPLAPAPPEVADVAQLEQLAEVMTALDLRHGGGLVSQLAKQLLRWAVPMLDTSGELAEPTARRLHASVGGLALRAAWAAFDVAAHEAARSLFRLALYASVRASDPDLRAHVLADVAAQHNYLGYHEDALEIIRMVGGDERVSPAVLMVLHGVRARAYAATGQLESCLRHVGLAEEAFAGADPRAPGWVGTLRHPAYLYATTGHATAQLARRSEDAAGAAEARERLTAAIDDFDASTHARAHALCVSRLALLNLSTGELDQGAHWARQALRCAERIRSVRLDHDLADLRAAAGAHPDEPSMQELVTELDAATGHKEE
jgi:transcriptional regulator with XRE-family HTH domain